MRLLISSVFIGFFSLITSAYAALDLELTQGVSSAMPIAVVPFAGQDDLQAPDNIGAVVSHDLNNSGRFKVADFSSLQQSPHTNQDVDYNYWQKRNSDDLVIGQVQPLGGDRYHVTFQLINVVAGQAQVRGANANFQDPVLLSQEFTVNKDGLRRLAHHISDLVYQKLTGDRGVFSTRIAYVLVSNQGGKPKYLLQVADIDGYNPQTLLSSNQPIMSPAWAPDGRSIAYVSFEGEDAAIYVQNVATGGRHLVSKYPGINGAPAWSPDGRKLALVLTKTGYPKIYVMTLGSGQLTQMTDGYSIDTEPSWSPDGNSLIFTSNRGGGPEIYQISLASHQIQRLTFNSNYNARASYTPDGNNIAMLTQAGNGYNIAIQDLQNGRVDVLTNSGVAQSPSIAPNGKMVVYADEYPDGTGLLGIVSTDGSVKLRLPAQQGTVQEPAWSPFL